MEVVQGQFGPAVVGDRGGDGAAGAGQGREPPVRAGGGCPADAHAAPLPPARFQRPWLRHQSLFRERVRQQN